MESEIIKKTSGARNAKDIKQDNKYQKITKG
jgi:hypothetical protein